MSLLRSWRSRRTASIWPVAAHPGQEGVSTDRLFQFLTTGPMEVRTASETESIVDNLDPNEDAQLFHDWVMSEAIGWVSDPTINAHWTRFPGIKLNEIDWHALSDKLRAHHGWPLLRAQPEKPDGEQHGDDSTKKASGASCGKSAGWHRAGRCLDPHCVERIAAENPYNSLCPECGAPATEADRCAAADQGLGHHSCGEADPMHAAEHRWTRATQRRHAAAGDEHLTPNVRHWPVDDGELWALVTPDFDPQSADQNFYSTGNWDSPLPKGMFSYLLITGNTAGLAATDPSVRGQGLMQKLILAALQEHDHLVMEDTEPGMRSLLQKMLNEGVIQEHEGEMRRFDSGNDLVIRLATLQARFRSRIADGGKCQCRGLYCRHLSADEGDGCNNPQSGGSFCDSCARIIKFKEGYETQKVEHERCSNCLNYFPATQMAGGTCRSCRPAFVNQDGAECEGCGRSDLPLHTDGRCPGCSKNAPIDDAPESTRDVKTMDERERQKRIDALIDRWQAEPQSRPQIEQQLKSLRAVRALFMLRRAVKDELWAPDPEIVKNTWRRYQCTVCGNVQAETTNHLGAIMSYCKKCSWAPSKGECYNPMGDGRCYRKFTYMGEIDERHQSKDDSVWWDTNGEAWNRRGDAFDPKKKERVVQKRSPVQVLAEAGFSDPQMLIGDLWTAFNKSGAREHRDHQITSVHLTGSRWKGDAREDSDLDVVVFHSGNAMMSEANQAFRAKVAEITGGVVDAFLLPATEAWDHPMSGNIMTLTASSATSNFFRAGERQRPLLSRWLDKVAAGEHDHRLTSVKSAILELLRQGPKTMAGVQDVLYTRGVSFHESHAALSELMKENLIRKDDMARVRLTPSMESDAKQFNHLVGQTIFNLERELRENGPRDPASLIALMMKPWSGIDPKFFQGAYEKALDHLEKAGKIEFSDAENAWKIPGTGRDAPETPADVPGMKPGERQQKVDALLDRWNKEPEKRQQIEEQLKSLRAFSALFRLRVAVRPMKNLGPALDRAQNMFGPLKPEIRKRILNFLQNPSTETWDDIQSIIISGFGTIWQGMLEVDPSFPRSGRQTDQEGNVIKDWERIPTPEQVLLVLEKNTGGERQSLLSSWIERRAQATDWALVEKLMKQHWDSRVAEDWAGGLDCTGDSEALNDLLHEAGMPAEHVSSYYRDANGNLWSHDWLELDGKVLDVTHSQFGAPDYLITNVGDQRYPSMDSLSEDEQMGANPSGKMPTASLRNKWRARRAEGADPAAGPFKAPWPDQIQAFMQAVYDQTVGHPFTRGQRVWDSKVIVEVAPWRGGPDPDYPWIISLKWLQSMEPGEGNARRCMEWLTALADQFGVFLDLHAKPTGEPRIPKKDLKNFYKDQGFERDRGQGPDDMMRNPISAAWRARRAGAWGPGNPFTNNGRLPDAACEKCGGWTNYGGMSQFFKDKEPTAQNLGRPGCSCAMAGASPSVFTPPGYVDLQDPSGAEVKKLMDGWTKRRAAAETQIGTIVYRGQEVPVVMPTADLDQWLKLRTDDRIIHDQALGEQFTALVAKLYDYAALKIEPNANIRESQNISLYPDIERALDYFGYGRDEANHKLQEPGGEDKLKTAAFSMFEQYRLDQMNPKQAADMLMNMAVVLHKDMGMTMDEAKARLSSLLIEWGGGGPENLHLNSLTMKWRERRAVHEARHSWVLNECTRCKQPYSPENNANPCPVGMEVCAQCGDPLSMADEEEYCRDCDPTNATLRGRWTQRRAGNDEQKLLRELVCTVIGSDSGTTNEAVLPAGAVVGVQPWSNDHTIFFYSPIYSKIIVRGKVMKSNQYSAPVQDFRAATDIGYGEGTGYKHGPECFCDECMANDDMSTHRCPTCGSRECPGDGHSIDCRKPGTMTIKDVPTETKDSLLDKFNRGEIDEATLRRRMKQISQSMLSRWHRRAESQAALIQEVLGQITEDEIANSGIANRATDFIWTRTAIDPKTTNWGRDAIGETQSWLKQEEDDYLSDMGEPRVRGGDEAKRQALASEPVVVIKGDDGVLWVLDGNHRTAQAVIWGIESLPALLGVKKPGVGRTPVDPDYKMGSMFERWVMRLANDPLKKIIEINGVKVGIEWPKGSTRTWKHLPGNDYEKLMKADYGYIRQTEGEDGEEIDVYAGPDRDSDLAFVVTQLDKKTGEYDEDKIMLGYGSEAEAKASYLEHMEKAHFGGIKKMSWDEFLKLVPKSQRVKERTAAMVDDPGSQMVLTDDLRIWDRASKGQGDKVESLVLPKGTTVKILKKFRLDHGGSPELLKITFWPPKGKAGAGLPTRGSGVVRADDLRFVVSGGVVGQVPEQSIPSNPKMIENHIVDLLRNGPSTISRDLHELLDGKTLSVNESGEVDSWDQPFSDMVTQVIGQMLDRGVIMFDGGTAEFSLLKEPEPTAVEHVPSMSDGDVQSKIDALLDQLAVEQDPKKKQQIEQRIRSLSAATKEVWRRRAGDTMSISEQRSPGAISECEHEWPGKKPGERGWCGRCRL